MPARKQKTPFDDWPRTPAAHFRLYFFATVSHLLHQLLETLETQAAVSSQFPFLEGYVRELVANEPSNLSAKAARDWWRTTINRWEAGTTEHLPLRALRVMCDLDHDAVTLVLGVGLIEEDARFGLLFGSMQGSGNSRRPSIGLLNALWRPVDGFIEARALLKRFDECGLITFSGIDAPRVEWTVEVPSILWDVLRGEAADFNCGWARYHPPEELCALKDLISMNPPRAKLSALPALYSAGRSGALIVRGPENNGRKTVVGAMARELGRGVLEVIGLDPNDSRQQLIGPLASVLNAVPVIQPNVLPGETLEITPLRGYRGLVGFV